MGEKVMKYSDLSGQLVENPDELATVTVVEHPDLDEPVRIDALPGELEGLGKMAIKAVMLDVQLPQEEEPTRYVVTTANFAKLATERAMTEVLDGAERVVMRRGRGNGGNAGTEARDHNTLEWAGTPHKGKTSPEEARLVRENLAAINERLAAQGLRTIDPGNPEHARRYGFDAPIPSNGD